MSLSTKNQRMPGMQGAKKVMAEERSIRVPCAPPGARYNERLHPLAGRLGNRFHPSGSEKDPSDRRGVVGSDPSPERGAGRTGRWTGTHWKDLSGKCESLRRARVTDSLPKRARIAANARAPALRSRPRSANSSSCPRDGCVLAERISMSSTPEENCRAERRRWMRRRKRGVLRVGTAGRMTSVAISPSSVRRMR